MRRIRGRLAARWLGQGFARIDAGAGSGIVRPPAHPAPDPNALAPMLQDDGFVLRQSDVIVRNLCTRHPGDLPIACEIHRWRGLPLPHPDHPHLARWYDDLRARPAARGVLHLAPNQP